MSKRVFIASPLGFAQSTTNFRTVIVTHLQQAGHEPVDPWTLTDDLSIEMEQAHRIENKEKWASELHRISADIAKRNAESLLHCDGVLAVLDGVDVDSGTASEIGFAYGSGGKIINGIRTDFRQSGENYGVSVNLQVQYWIENSGGQIIHSVEQIASLSF